ncbi:hypothetical protein V8C26DRAFT_439292 [Trichoderma gracile]
MMNMISLLLLPLLAALPQVWAGANGQDMNVTFAFFPTDQVDACSSYDVSKAITLTTESLPVQQYTCFNMSDIFSQNKSTGFQPLRSKSDRDKLPGGVHWSIDNQELYDPNANYTWTWLKMGSAQLASQDPLGPQLSPWIFYQYTLADCEQSRPGDDQGDATPWSMTDCGTPDEGLCMSTSRPIRSFAINGLGYHAHREGGCWGWETFGNAAASSTRAGTLLVAVAAAVLVAL